MQKHTIILSDYQLQNLVTFLDRVEIKGFKEINCMNELLEKLQNPIDTEDSKE